MLLGAAGRFRTDWLGITPSNLQEAKAEGYAVLNVVVRDPKQASRDNVQRFKEMFAEAGLEIGQTNGQYGGGLVSPDEAHRRGTIEFAKRMADLTAQLGSPNTYLRPGSMNLRGPWLPHPENRSPEVFDRLVDSSRQFCKAAEEAGVKVSVEGGVVSPLYSARRVRDFIDAVGSPALGFNQDPVNFVSGLEDAYDTTTFLQPFFDLLGDVTLGAHAKDFKVVDQLLIHFEEEEIGSGLMDHVTFLRNMQEVCPKGHVLIEHLPPDRFADAIRNFKGYSEKAGIVWDRPHANAA